VACDLWAFCLRVLDTTVLYFSPYSHTHTGPHLHSHTPYAFLALSRAGGGAAVALLEAALQAVNNIGMSTVTYYTASDGTMH
jgi:hypothetical protein